MRYHRPSPDPFVGGLVQAGRVSLIASWNMNDKPPGNRQKWSYLAALGADVALVQEAAVPGYLRSVHRAGGIAGRDGKERRWGSAVVALNDAVTLTPVGLAEGIWQGRGLGLAPIDAVGRGHVAIAVAELPELTLTVISAYGLMEFGYASGTLLRTLADLEPLLDDPGLGTNVLLGGDWNIGTWWSGQDSKYAKREAAVLDLLTAYGFVDCLDAHLPPDRPRLAGCRCELKRCRHIWTYKKAGSEVAYMDDYLFATPAVAALLTTARAVPDWDWTLSDHVPLVAVFGSA
jgi:hypothetical protein